jgi:uncharacterized membrane protein YhhN
VTLGAVVCAFGTAGLLIAERLDRPAWRWLFKPLASAGFLLAAVRAPAFALPHGPGVLLLCGLALSALGDVLLLPASKRAFTAGMAAFAFAHVAYATWFVGSGVSLTWLAIAAGAALAAGHLAWRWLDPHVRGGLRPPVRAYIALVSLMAAAACAHGAHVLTAGVPSGGSPEVAMLAPAIGGVAFYLSDLAVARNRFVRPGFVNRAWGLPLYYVAQLLIASAV